METRPISFYMANLWSEIEQIYVFRERKDAERLRGAFNRALSIMDTIKTLGNTSASAEIAILENVVHDLESGSKKYAVERKHLAAYLNVFARKAMQK